MGCNLYTYLSYSHFFNNKYAIYKFQIFNLKICDIGLLSKITIFIIEISLNYIYI